ncbi:MAG: hypothetical protein ACXIUB_05880 [Wenzhouxiangella sp.]
MLTIKNTRLPLRYLASCLMLIGLLAAASNVQAQRLPTTSPGPDAAVIVGTPGKTTQDLFSVRFVGIDGRNIQAREIMWLEPGRYELRVLVNANFSRMGPQRRLSRHSRQADRTIEVEIEAGKRYHIRARYNREERSSNDPYNIIVWKVEEI